MKQYEYYKTTEIPWVSQVPSHWSLIRNANILTLKHSVVGEQYTQYDLLSLTTGGIKIKNADDTRGKVPASFEGYQEVLPGEMVFCLFDLDCSAVFSGKSEYHGMITSAYDVAVPNLSLVSSSYLDYWFRTVFSGRYYKIYSKSVRYTINWDIFKTLKTPVPPREEQDQIVRYLDWQVSKINRLIAAKRKQITLLKEQKQRRITHIVTHGIKPNVPHKDSGIAWIGAIPAHWHCVALKRCAKVKSGITLGKQYPVGTKLVSVPYLRVANVQDGFVSIETVTTLNVTPEEAAQYALPKGCVLMTEGGDRDKLGRGCVWNGEIENCIHQNHIFAVTVNDKLLLNKWLEYVSACDIGRMYFDITAIKTTNLACTNASKVMAFPIPLPPRDEQERITDELNRVARMFNDIRKGLEKQIERLQELRTRLISDVVTGQVDVRGIEVPEFEMVNEIDTEEPIEEENDQIE